MIIFLRHIPAGSQKHEIASFIEPMFDDCPLDPVAPKATVQNIEFLSLRDIGSNIQERHALVTVLPNEVARHVLKRIDGAMFKGAPLSAREYVMRSLANDPRNGAGADEAIERRISERRRKPLPNAWQQNPIPVYSL